MAFAMIGGILAATFLTLLFLPALYVGCYRIRPLTTPRRRTPPERRQEIAAPFAGAARNGRPAFSPPQAGRP